MLDAALIGTFASSNPQIYTALITRPHRHGPAGDQHFLDERGPDYLLDQITAPTLLIQGTVDTLFTLQEAHANAKALIANGVPTKVVWYCGGHGGCISSVNDGEMIEQATLAWLDRYVKGDFPWPPVRSSSGSTSTARLLVEHLSGRRAPRCHVEHRRRCVPLLPFIGGSGPNSGALPRVRSLRCSEFRPARGINALDLTIPEARRRRTSSARRS